MLHHQLDWTDLKYFLELVRCGTISLAGDRLQVQHTTVARRIDKLERELNTVLFDRRRDGYALTDAGKLLIPFAERMESAVIAAIDECVGSQHGESTVRIGTPEAFGAKILASSIPQLLERHHNIHVELMSQPQFPSLVSREVEILVTMEPPEMGRYKIARLVDVDYYLYAAPAYLNDHDPIREIADIRDHRFIDYIHEGLVSERYGILKEVTPSPRRIFTATSVLAQRQAAIAGAGLVLLAPYVADPDGNELVSLFPDRPMVTRSLWIATPEDLFKTRRIRCVWEHVRDTVANHPSLGKKSSSRRPRAT